jgi:hypothetical protein
MSTICTSNLTSGFIDLATYDEQEKYMYGGPDATAYFVRDTRKSTWFTQVPVVLSRASGQPAWNQDWSVSISRAGDYLLYTWLRVQIPAVTLATNNAYGVNGTLRWTRNLAHNLIRECCITFNDLVAARFDNFHLDFWSAFTTPAGKQNGYKNMIGDVDELIQPVSATAPEIRDRTLPSYTLNLPLPFFYSRDSGVALPTAALPYNDMRISFSFRNWTELLVLQSQASPDNDPCSGSIGFVSAQQPTNSDLLNGSAPGDLNAQVWANYAIVSNDERKRMACAPRDILIEQVQTAPIQTFQPQNNNQPQYDIRFSHAVKALFFAARNTTIYSQWSNYTTYCPEIAQAGADCTRALVVYNGPLNTDPIINTSLIYENTQRLYQMGSDYFSLVNPWYHAPVIPNETGYHEYSYSLDFFCLDPMGSTNYGKLTNVSIIPAASNDAFNANLSTTSLQASNVARTTGLAQTYSFITTCVNNNIIRISGGARFFSEGSNSKLLNKLQNLLVRENSVKICVQVY